MKLSEASCVVTGAARGIGFAIARALLQQGARLTLNDANRDALAEAATRLGPAINAEDGDVSSFADMGRLAESATRRFGRIDVWVNNAGLARHRRITDYTEAEIDLMLAVNLKGVIAGSQAALRAMAPLRRGHIVNIISTASLRGIPTETVYCAVKAGARCFTQGLREEAAAHHVRVSAILPGGVDTAFWNDASRDRVIPTEKFLTADQVASAVLDLLRMEDSVVPQELILRAMLDRDFST